APACAGYVARPQKERSAESASHGKVARKRYSGAVPRTARGVEWTTGHQKRRPEAKKVACWTRCQELDRRPSSCAAGTCHATTTSVPTSPHPAGWVRARPARRP